MQVIHLSFREAGATLAHEISPCRIEIGLAIWVLSVDLGTGSKSQTEIIIKRWGT